MPIPIYDKYSKIPKAGSTSNGTGTVHGMTTAQLSEMTDRLDKSLPHIANIGQPQSRLRSIFDDMLPPDASWSPRTGQSMSTSQGPNNVMLTSQQPYQPEFADPSRQNYPVHRILANRYWRLFHKLDPVIGNCIELYSELPWSNFELTGDGVEGDIRQAYEYMCKETQLLALLPYFVREFLVAGETIPHTFFSDEKGVFTYIALHNPDQIDVIDAPFIKMDPIVNFIPDDRLRAVLSSSDPALAKIKQSMPQELMNKLSNKEPITLSPVNCTFLPRKLHPYDTRGTSLLSRLWRVLMYEDAIFASSIQTARRASAPLKVAKLGNAATGWIPPAEHERKLLELLAQAEQDPQAWLVYNYGISFEMIGTNDRAMSINREWDSIEKMKLAALGVSKAFLSGDVTYSNAATGLQVFLQRLKSLRMHFEQRWMYPKFFKPIAEINGWIKPKPSEVSHRYRVKRSARELDDQNAYIMPKIVWDKTLDPQINNDLIQAMTGLEAIGVKFSKTSKMAAVGFSFEEETKKIHREFEFEKQFLPSTQAAGGSEQGAGGPPAGGGGAPPPGGPPPMEDPNQEGPAAPGTGGDMPPNVDTNPAPIQPASKGLKTNATEGAEKSDAGLWQDDKYGNWSKSEYEAYVDGLDNPDASDAFWHDLMLDKDLRDSYTVGDMDTVWDATDKYLNQHGYPYKDIDEFRALLEKTGILPKPEAVHLADDILKALPDDPGSMSDMEFAAAVAKVIDSNKNAKINKDSFLVGVDSTDSSPLISDISGMLKNR